MALPLGKREINRFADVIRRLPPGPLTPAQVTTDELRLFGTWDLACYYAPLDHVEQSARAVLVATCPPVAQAAAAHMAARDALQAGLPQREAWRRAATAAGPGGTFRTNLAHMLDGLGLAKALGLPSVRTELGPFSRIHFTYCVRYPVIVNDRDYSGRRPQLLRYRPLARFVEQLLLPELASLPEAIVVPLGRVAGEAIASLIDAGRLELERCLLGVPNPSGANGHREEDYERSRDELRLQLAAWFDRHPADISPSAEAG